jgi:hypothetical protein
VNEVLKLNGKEVTPENIFDIIDNEDFIIENKVGDIFQVLDLMYDEEFCLKGVAANGKLLKYIKNQTEEIISKAIETEGHIIAYADHQSDENIYKAFANSPIAFREMPFNDHTLKIFYDATCAADKYSTYPLSLLHHFQNKKIGPLKPALRPIPAACKFLELSEAERKDIINDFPEAISVMDDPSPGLCELAVENDPATLRFIHPDNQTEEMCLKVLDDNWENIRYVKNMTPTIAEKAMKINYQAALFVPGEGEYLDLYNKLLTKEEKNNIDQLFKQISDEYKYVKMFREGHSLSDQELIDADYRAFPAMRHQDHEIVKQVMAKDGSFLQFVWDKTFDICLEAVKNDGIAIIYVPMKFLNDPDKYEQLTTTAIDSRGYILSFVDNKNPNVESISIEKNGRSIACLPDDRQLPKYQIKAVNDDADNIQFITNRTDEAIDAALKKSPDIARFLKAFEKTEERCYAMIDYDITTFRYVDYRKYPDIKEHFQLTKLKMA